MLPSVIPVYKPIGLTPLQALHRLKKERPELQSQKLAYAGRLDPMADGLLLVLVGEECKKRDIYQKLPKTYEVEVLFGFETDTYDIMGKITNTYQDSFTQDFFQHAIGLLPQFMGRYSQPYPPYSSARVQGKPLFYYARTNTLHTLSIPKKEIEIQSIHVLSQNVMSGKNILQTIQEKVSATTGDFRQKEIILDWKKELKADTSYPVVKISVESSAGAYMRSLAHEWGKRINTGAIAYSIKRIAVGDFTLKDSLTLSGAKDR